MTTTKVSSKGTESPTLTPDDRARLEAHRASIENAFVTSPSEAVRTFKNVLLAETGLVGKALKHTLGTRFEWIGKASLIRQGVSALFSLAKDHGSASRAQRRLLIDYAVDELIALSLASGKDEGARETLERLGTGFTTFVLDGTVPQQLICKLAIRIGVKIVPPDLLKCLGDCLLDALITILEVGAPATRDSAVEGVGAIVKLLTDRAYKIPDPPDPVDDPGLDEAANKIRTSYIHRRQRQRLMALAIANIGDYSDRLLDGIERPADQDLDHRAQFLRILPAMCRQRPSGTAAELRERCIRLLLQATLNPSDGTSAFASYQESVFQTISVMIDRGVDPNAFDDVVASAVQSLPPTLIGPAAQSNAYVRSTMAVINTAARIAGGKRYSNCERALRPLFENLKGDSYTDSIWLNPGILEGCLQSLPSLVSRTNDSSWTVPALDSVLRYLDPPFPPQSDLVSMHRRLCANRCLRRVLVALMERKHRERHESRDDPQETEPDVEDNEILAHLLANPTARAFFNAFQTRKSSGSGGMTPHWLSHIVIGAADFEAEIRGQLPHLFDSWTETTDARRLLLTRILANQLRCLSHDARQIGWYPALQRKLGTLPGQIPDAEHALQLMKVLSNIHSDAANAVDSDLQDFLRHRSRRSGQQENLGESNDLPPYVLAMISETVSYRLATEIAREADLSFRRARLSNPDFDLAALLYHVMLHGPDRAIYYHLIPRMKAEDYPLVCLFADHVHSVRSCRVDHGYPRERLDKLLEHIKRFLPRLRKQKSHLLKSLCDVLDVYSELADDMTVWFAIQGKESFLQLLSDLDTLAGDTRKHLRTATASGEAKAQGRTLADDCKDECAALLSKVRHYIDLSVGQFDERRTTLEQAAELVANLRKKLEGVSELHPPERVLLIALLDRWEDMFRQTIEWFVDAPHRCRETRQPRLFWRTFITRETDKDEVQSRDALLDSIMGPTPGLFGRLRFFDDFFERGWESPAEFSEPDVLGLSGTKPPEKPGQRQELESFYVDWMSSELDVDHLAWALSSRWPDWFKPGYFFMANLWLCLILIAIPFALTIVADIVDTEFSNEIAGVGFFIYAAALLIVTAITLTGGVRRRGVAWLRMRFGSKSVPVQEDEQPQQYLYQSTLPRLLRLIVFPLALIVDFDHSYYFPTHASNVVILLLMALALLTTNYFVTVELRRRGKEIASPEATRTVGSRRHVRQIVSIALAHAFALALIFSIIFEANTVKRFDEEDRHFTGKSALEDEVKTTVKKPMAPVWTVPVPIPPEPPLSTRARRWLLKRFDSQGRYFFGILPRRTSFDLGKCIDRWLYAFNRRHLNDSVLLHLRFDYYPTLILSWTALGLFFGVFLEGFLKGERLRGEER
jgi:hypothetical protein